MSDNQVRVYDNFAMADIGARQRFGKAQPTPGDVHNNTPLTNFSVAWFQQQGAFAASSAFPTLPVAKQSDLYYTWTRADFNRDDAKVRAPGTRVFRNGATPSTDSYNALVYEFGDAIPDEVRANSDAAVNLDMNKTRRVMQQLMIRRERQFASTFLTTGVWTTDITGHASTNTGSNRVYWSTSTSTPIQCIADAKVAILLATGVEANTLVLGYAVREALRYHPDLIARVNAGQTPGGPAEVTDDVLKNIFGIPNIVVSKAIYNTAKEGGTESNSFIAGKNALLCYSDPNPTLDSPTAGMTFAWTGFPGASSSGTLVRTMRIDQEYTDEIHGFMSFDMKKVSADCGYFFSGIVA